MRYQVRRQGADPSKEPSVEGSSGCAVGSPPGPLMEADKEVVGGTSVMEKLGVG